MGHNSSKDLNNNGEEVDLDSDLNIETIITEGAISAISMDKSKKLSEQLIFCSKLNVELMKYLSGNEKYIDWRSVINYSGMSAEEFIEKAKKCGNYLPKNVKFKYIPTSTDFGFKEDKMHADMEDDF